MLSIKFFKFHKYYLLQFEQHGQKLQGKFIQTDLSKDVVNWLDEDVESARGVRDADVQVAVTQQVDEPHPFVVIGTQ